MRRVTVKEFLMDMTLNVDKNAEFIFVHEDTEFILEVTEKDARAVNHLFEMARMAGDTQ